MNALPYIASGTAHGKIILIGEHSVVHNEPAIAIPFTSANVEVSIEELFGESTIESIYHTGRLRDAPKALDNLIETLEAVCTYFNQKSEHMHIIVDSSIPAESGMGSSAAVATALIRALFKYFNTELTDDLLNRFVTISEAVAHGNPSGLDAKVVLSNKPVYFIRNKKPVFFNMALPGYLVVADTGQKGETGQAVADVGALVSDPSTNARTLVLELGKLTKDAHKHIKDKNLIELGKVLTLAQSHLKELTVSNETLDLFVQTALDNGALGAKLTGGGRGGCMFALTDSLEEANKISKALLNVGAVDTWIHPLGDKTL